MKISAFESGQAGHSEAVGPEAKILPADFHTAARQSKKKAKTSREEAIEVAMAAMEDVPEVREDLVSEIKARIESGQYSVDGNEVADMMIRRMKADRIR